MDTTNWLILGGLALIVLIAAVVMLNRSWGNFPDRAGTLPPAGSSAPGMSSSTSDRPASWQEQRQLGTPAQPVAVLELTGQDGGLVPIEHTLTRRAADQALARGGPITKYIVRQGDQLYFDFSQIEDLEQRQEAYDLMRRFNAGQDVDIAAMMRLIQKLFQS